MMNRIIKFRAWDGIKKRMVDMSQPASVENGLTYEGYYHLLGGRGFNFPVMQYTGLKDKNGVEIYEGDIVSFETMEELCEVNYIAQIKWDKFCACWEVRANDTEWLLDINESLDVIGNIYETPELLK